MFSNWTNSPSYTLLYRENFWRVYRRYPVVGLVCWLDSIVLAFHSCHWYLSFMASSIKADLDLCFTSSHHFSLTHQFPCRHGTYTEAILNQCNSFRSEPILNVSWTNLTRRFDQTSFMLLIVVWIILVLYNPFVDCLYFGLVQDSFSIHSHPYIPIHSDWASSEPQLNQ